MDTGLEVASGYGSSVNVRTAFSMYMGKSLAARREDGTSESNDFYRLRAAKWFLYSSTTRAQWCDKAREAAASYEREVKLGYNGKPKSTITAPDGYYFFSGYHVTGLKTAAPRAIQFNNAAHRWFGLEAKQRKLWMEKADVGLRAFESAKRKVNIRFEEVEKKKKRNQTTGDPTTSGKRQKK